MKLATVDLTPELFAEFCKASKTQGYNARNFKVKANPLPDDAKVVSVQLRNSYPPHTLQLIIESESFQEVQEGATPPELPLPVYEVVFDSELDAIRGCADCLLCDRHADYAEGKHYTLDKNIPICANCGLADIAGDWEKYACDDEWRKEIATHCNA